MDSLRILRNSVGIGLPRRCNFSIVKELLRDGRTSAPARQGIILASGEFGVCDGGHRLIVMKNDERCTPAEDNEGWL